MKKKMTKVTLWDKINEKSVYLSDIKFVSNIDESDEIEVNFNNGKIFKYPKSKFHLEFIHNN